MALGAKEAASSTISIFSSYISTSLKLHSFNKSLSSVRLGTSTSPPAAASLKFSLYKLPHVSTKKHGFQLHSAVEIQTVEEEEEEEEEEEAEEEEEGEGEEEVGSSRKAENRRKLFVLNLPWSLTVADIKKVFGECGTVADVEIIKQKDGKNRGFAFVTMASGEAAQAAIQKFDSSELAGRIIRVQFAKRLKKAARAVAIGPPRGETRFKLYVSNLAWKVRSTNLREFFSSNLRSTNPVSVRVVFDSPSGRSAGYGFVSFATKEEAESAISALNGRELMGRPIRLKFSERNSGASEKKEELSSDASKSEEESSEQTT